jgi:hypothetical protein
MVQTVTGNLLEEQTAMRFEFFKGVNLSSCISVIDFFLDTILFKWFCILYLIFILISYTILLVF